MSEQVKTTNAFVEYLEMLMGREDDPNYKVIKNCIATLKKISVLHQYHLLSHTESIYKEKQTELEKLNTELECLDAKSLFVVLIEEWTDYNNITL